jgi:hypothetical protein
MMRSAAHPCPVAACSNTRQRWQAVCRACWRRLPVDLTAVIQQAKQMKAPHLRARAEMAATAWLNAHPIADAIARICGESPAPP